MIIVLIKVIAAVLLADFLTGVVHWIEDAYGNPNWRFIGASIIIPNLEHHQKPRAFIKGTWWTRVNTSIIGGILLVGVFYLCAILNVYTALAILLATQGNEVHRFSHQTKKENGPIITGLQKIRVLQSIKHHARHHQAPYACHYCVMTNLMNPILDFIHFWQGIEWFLDRCLGIKVLRGSVLRNGV